MNDIAFRIYQSIYEEKESRTTQDRIKNKLTPEQRREQYPSYEKGAISKNEGEETNERNDLSGSAVNSKSGTSGKNGENQQNKNSRLDTRENAEATSGRRGEEGAGASEINYALDENDVLEMEQDLSL